MVDIRRTRWAVLVVTAVVASGITLARSHQDPPGPQAVTSSPSAYVGSRWRLLTVTDSRGATDVGSAVDAWIELAGDGTFTANDSINMSTARFAVTTTGFDVGGGLTTLAGSRMDDPVLLAAIVGIDALTSATADQPVHVTVVSAERENLTVEAGGVRLRFARA
jgi:hypothetical protein